MMEAGRPITVTTLLRICEVFELSMAKLSEGWIVKGFTMLWMLRFHHAGGGGRRK
jgi:hypothetical protein